MSDAIPPSQSDEMLSACRHVIHAHEIGSKPLIDTVRELHRLCAELIEAYDEDTKRITREIMSAIFGNDPAKVAP
jgi:hypothetical protein